MDDEYVPCGNRDPRPQTPQASHRHWRDVGDLSRLSRVEGLRLTLRPDLDQRHGESARLSEHRRMFLEAEAQRGRKLASLRLGLRSKSMPRLRQKRCQEPNKLLVPDTFT